MYDIVDPTQHSDLCAAFHPQAVGLLWAHHVQVASSAVSAAENHPGGRGVGSVHFRHPLVSRRPVASLKASLHATAGRGGSEVLCPHAHTVAQSLLLLENVAGG